MSAVLDDISGTASRDRGTVPVRSSNSLLWAALALVTAATGLVSCADRPALPSLPPAPVVVSPPPAAIAPVPSAAAAPVPRHKPVPPARTPAPAPAAPFSAAPDFQADRSIDPGRLVGLTELETLRLLGAPLRKADIPPAKYWQYASRRCVLRVFFFMEMDSRDFRTLSYELKSVNNDPAVDQQCLADFVAQAERQ